MIETVTDVNNGYLRTITVTKNEGGTFLKLKSNTSGKYEQAYLPDDKADQIALNLLDLPEVKEEGEYLSCNGTFRRLGYYSGTVLSTAKSLLAISLELQKREEAAKVEEEKAEAELKELYQGIIDEHWEAFLIPASCTYSQLSSAQQRVVYVIAEQELAKREREAHTPVPF